ncbi:MAG TPA: acylphosphatase [Longimicrobiales bacterium]|nr:acylphosphatase [Longimicrobiales bacterium]
MERKRYRVHGRVQGVGFRVWLLRHAESLALRGWACNRGDGSVEVEAAGGAEALARLATLLGQGPRLARVDTVEELPPSPGALPDRFEIITGSRHG